MWQWQRAFYALSLISLFTFYKRGIPLPAPYCAQLPLCPALTEHAQFIAIPTEGLDFKSSFPVIFPDSRFLVLPQLFFSTCLFPTPSLPFALISMFSSLPLTFMSRTRQRQDRTDIRESSLKTEKEKKKTSDPLWHVQSFLEKSTSV